MHQASSLRALMVWNNHLLQLLDFLSASFALPFELVLFRFLSCTNVNLVQQILSLCFKLICRSARCEPGVSVV